jgi:hypothetical protein
MAVTDYAAPLVLFDLPVPEVPPGYVLVRILACGVCYTDVRVARGRMTWSSSIELPHVPGHEVSAEVIEAPPETGFQPGERVLVYNYWSCGRCPACLIGREVLCENLEGWVGVSTPGGFHEYLSVRPDRLVRVPEWIEAEEVCAASCAFGTGYRAVATRGRVQPGEVVVILGAGEVGLHTLQIAREANWRRRPNSALWGLAWPERMRRPSSRTTPRAVVPMSSSTSSATKRLWRRRARCSGGAGALWFWVMCPRAFRVFLPTCLSSTRRNSLGPATRSALRSNGSLP